MKAMEADELMIREPRFYNSPPSPAMRDAYADEFLEHDDEWPYELTSWAFREHRLRSPFWPSLSELRALMYPPRDESVAEAWGEVMQYREKGWLSPKWSTPLLTETVGQITWGQIREADYRELNFLRQDFTRFFETNRQKQVEAERARHRPLLSGHLVRVLPAPAEA